MKKRLFVFFVSVFLVLIVASVVSACGGFFSADTDIDQSAERIIFTVNGNDTITAYIGIEYEGAAEDFSWLLPVPSVPEVDVAEKASLDTLQDVTNRIFTAPENPCNLVPPDGLGGGGGYVTGSTGPYDYVVLTDDDPQVVVNWLRELGYNISDDVIPLIEYYVVVEKMDILAMRLSQGFEAGDIKPVKLTYSGEHPMIPIILTSVAATSDMPILTWIFGDTQYVPMNWAHVTPDYTTFGAPSQLLGDSTYFTAFRNYSNVLRQIQADHDGLAFVTEYAQPTMVFRDLPGVADDMLLKELSKNYAFVTRLRAQLSPEQMTVDPTFVPAESESHVSNLIDLNDYVDPLHYWGCSSRRLAGSDPIDLTGIAFQTVRRDGIDVSNYPYPEGWVVTDLSEDLGGIGLSVFAEQAVTLDDVIANFQGTNTIPMMLYADADPYYGGTQYLYQALGLDPYGRMPQIDGLYIQVTSRYNLYRWYQENLLLVTTDADYEANADVYDRMRNVFSTFQYFKNAELRQTLFLGDINEQFNATGIFSAFHISYADGWIEYLDDDKVVTIVPEGFDPNDADAPFIRVRTLSSINEENFFVSPTSLDSLMTAYQLTDDARAELFNGFYPDPERTYYCHINAPDSVMFERDGRQGYISAVAQYYVEASANIADFETYADDMRLSASSLVAPLSSCG